MAEKEITHPLLSAFPAEQIVDQADPAEQAEFLAEVEARHKVSSVASVDDFPVEVYKWDTEFPIYGTKYVVRRQQQQ